VPRVSVLLPVRDAGPVLNECLSSLQAQTLTDLEVVAVDDGSSDGSTERLSALAALDPRCRLLRTPAQGLPAALNAAAAAARSPLLARMDADDIAHPQRLALQVEFLDAHPEIAVVGCRVRLTGSVAAGNQGMRDYLAWQNQLLDHQAMARDLFVESPLVHPSVIMRAEALTALGGYRAFEGPEDYDLWLRAFEAGYGFAKLPQVLLDWRDSERRLTRCDSRYAPERFRALKIEVLGRRYLRGGRPVAVWGAGPIGKGWARALQASGHSVCGFVEVDRRKIGRRIGGTPVLGLAEVPQLSGCLHLAAVGQPGARSRIREVAAGLGLVDGVDLLAVA